MKLKFSCFLIAFLFLLATSSAQENPSELLMVKIPAGEYLMGKNANNNSDFSPAHQVKIKAFLIDVHEVTNAEYFKFCKETGNVFPEFWNTETFRSGEDFMNYPVVGVNWVNANKYAAWVGKRLPTEAEWEYAARGGLIEKEFPNGDYWPKERAKQSGGAWVNLIDSVKKYDANGYGIYDMGGNVWEWTSDYYSKDYYKQSETENPSGPKTGTHRVIRGGSWHSGAMCKKVYYRKGLPASWCDFGVGFRCAKDID